MSAPPQTSGSAALAFWAAFAAVAGILYVVSMELNWALVTYHPRPVELDLGTQPARNGPVMYWYGWMATSVLGGLAAGLVARFAADRVPACVWLGLGWVVPALAMAAAAYFMIPFFTKG